MPEKEKPKGEENVQSPRAPARLKVTEISKSSISELGGKLDGFAKNLSEDEQVTLATLFALAARGFSTFTGPVSCTRDLRIGIGQDVIAVERASESAIPKLSESFADAFLSRESRPVFN